jgi:glycosyltransferase involved in cell wall biosynthesis
LRILFAVHQFFPEYYAGTERLALNLCKQMQRMGHSVKVLTYGITDTDGFRSDGDILVKEYVFQGVPVLSFKHRTMPEELNFAIFDPSVDATLDKLLFKENFDIVHVCHPMRTGPVIRWTKRKGIPVVLSLTDFWLMCPKGILITNKGELCTSAERGTRCISECWGDYWKERLLQRVTETDEVFHAADCIVSATHFLKSIFESNNFTSNIKLIPYGTDYRYVQPNLREYSKKSKITIGFLSTLVPHKGANVLLEAFKLAKTKNIRLKVYGHYFDQIEYYRTLQKMAHGNRKIEFLGAYKYEQQPEIYKYIDLLAVPSIWWENSPLILLSALAHKVPAIVSNLGGMTEIVRDGENAFAYDVGNAGSLAGVLRHIDKDPTILNKLKDGIRYPPRLEEEAFMYEETYLSLLGKNS